jgi:hypothetical protein
MVILGEACLFYNYRQTGRMGSSMQNTHAQNEAYFQSAEYAEWCRLARINEHN